MFALKLYLATLLIAPQLWIPPFIGWPTDYIIYPMLFMVILVQSERLNQCFSLTTHDRLFLGLVIWIALSAIANGLTDESKYEIFLYVKFFLLYKLVIAAVGNLDRARSFINFFVLLTLVLAFEAIQQKFSTNGSGWANQGRAWIDPSILRAGGVGRSRWIGVFDGPGVFCVLFTIALPFFLQHLNKGLPLWKRALSSAFVLLLLGAIYCTGSRGGLLASLAVICLYIMLRIGISIRAMVASGALILLVYSVAPAYLTSTSDESHSGQHRVQMWAEGLDMLKEAPVFGIGRGNFQTYTSFLIAHNSAVEIGGETGLVGLSLWISLIYVSVKGTVAYLKATEKPEEKDFCNALILGVIGYLISAMFVTLEYETFYLLLAVCAVVARCAPAVVHLNARDYYNISAIVVLWIIILQIFVIQYFG